MAPRIRPPLERFWGKVALPAEADGCLVWTAVRQGKGGDYGGFYFQGRMRPAHVVAYLLLVGPIPEGLQLDHLCRNKLCVNVNHLEPVTGRVNIRRRFGWTETHCGRGHDITPPGTLISKKRQVKCRECHNSARRKAA